MHTITLAKDKSVITSRIQRISSQAVSTIYMSLEYHQFLIEINEELVLTNKIDWSMIVQVHHAIGDLYIVYRRQSDGIRVYLEDMPNGTVIRELDESLRVNYNVCILMIGTIFNNQVRHGTDIEYYGPD
jgi:hypothetical protein